MRIRISPIFLRSFFKLATQFVVNEDSRDFTTASQRKDALTMPFAIFESSRVTFECV
jgi:hypothetical protein